MLEAKFVRSCVPSASDRCRGTGVQAHSRRVWVCVSSPGSSGPASSSPSWETAVSVPSLTSCGVALDVANGGGMVDVLESSWTCLPLLVDQGSRATTTTTTPHPDPVLVLVAATCPTRVTYPPRIVWILNIQIPYSTAHILVRRQRGRRFTQHDNVRSKTPHRMRADRRVASPRRVLYHRVFIVLDPRSGLWTRP